MDQETQKIYSDGEVISEYIKSKGWARTKEILTNKILDLQSVMNIKRVSVTEMAREVYARQAAAEILYEVIRDVEGEAEKHTANLELMHDHIEII